MQTPETESNEISRQKQKEAELRARRFAWEVEKPEIFPKDSAIDQRWYVQEQSSNAPESTIPRSGGRREKGQAKLIAEGWRQTTEQ